MAISIDLRTWLQKQCAEYTFNVGGVFQRDSAAAWRPLTAAEPTELEERLSRGGHLLPLPREPAALANVLEVSIVNFPVLRAQAIEGAETSRAPKCVCGGAVVEGHGGLGAADRRRRWSAAPSRVGRCVTDDRGGSVS